MSTFWTPDGERPINKSTQQPSGSSEDSETGGESSAGGESMATGDPMADLSPEEQAAAKEQMDKLREQLAQVPASVVVANHGFGLFELAAIHLSSQPPNLDEARLAIDALTAIATSLEGRLGEAEAQLREGLNQLQMGYVQISQMVEGMSTSGQGGEQPQS